MPLGPSIRGRFSKSFSKGCRVRRRITVKGVERGIGDDSHTTARSMELDVQIEVTVICSQDAIRQLAVRIEHAYSRKYPKWLPIGLTPGVWESASARLLEASNRGANIPIDPELFVAVQARNRLAPDPWAELTQQRSLNQYIKALRRIIGQLRRELKGEVRRSRRSRV
jgi:hypothetical protein